MRTEGPSDQKANIWYTFIIFYTNFLDLSLRILINLFACLTIGKIGSYDFFLGIHKSTMFTELIWEVEEKHRGKIK